MIDIVFDALAGIAVATLAIEFSGAGKLWLVASWLGAPGGQAKTLSERKLWTSNGFVASMHGLGVEMALASTLVGAIPCMKEPVLEQGQAWLIGSDSIPPSLDNTSAPTPTGCNMLWQDPWPWLGDSGSSLPPVQLTSCIANPWSNCNGNALGPSGAAGPTVLGTAKLGQTCCLSKPSPGHMLGKEHGSLGGTLHGKPWLLNTMPPGQGTDASTTGAAQILGIAAGTLGGTYITLGQGNTSQPLSTLPPGQGNGAVSPSPWLMLGKPLGRLGGADMAFGQGNPSQLVTTLPPGQGNGAAFPST